LVTDVPQEKGKVQRVASRIGDQQDTIYGWTWHVKSKPRAENVAYTNQFLGLHQDLMYWDPIPELQLLHCHSNDCEGGESLFSHGVRAAYELKHAHPEHYDALTSIKCFFGYHKGGYNFARGHPTIIADRNHNITETRWSPPFQEAFPLTSGDQGDEDLRRWKAAAAQFKAIAESPGKTFEMKLKPGDCVIFNNRKILHGRRQFSQSQTGEGSRWLEGTYIAPSEYAKAVGKPWGKTKDQSAKGSKKKQRKRPSP
jgi:alpha-ketoglutarate-dependent taurine dioxygenase